MRFDKLITVTAAVVLLAGGAAAFAQGDCKAQLRTTYLGPDEKADSEYVDHVFAIEVETQESCAKVSYSLSVVEKYPDGETRTKNKHWTQSYRAGDAKTRKAKYRLHRKTVVQSHEFKLTGCKLCGSPD